MNRDLLHPITDEEKRLYDEDGVVCIRGQFDQEWIEQMHAVCTANDVNPGGARSVQDDEDDPGRFVAATHMSRDNADIMNFAKNSPAAQIAAQLMNLDKVRFFYDQLFVKAPGTLAPTAWHNDLPFWPFNGNHVASVWVALTDTPKENSGLVYVGGSHKWHKMYYPEPATQRSDFIFDPKVEEYERCPMFHEEFENPDYRFLSWDLKAGDCLVHHPLVVHGSGKNASLDHSRVAISVRYYGGDATWNGRRTAFQVPGTSDDMFEPGVIPINDEIFPVVWQA